MKLSCPSYLKRFLILLVAVAGFTALFRLGIGGPGTVEAKLSQDTTVQTQAPLVFPPDNPKVQAALAAQRVATPQLLARPEVVGTATGVGDLSEPSLLVFVKKAVPPGTLPLSVDGVPVKVKVTGEIRALAATAVYPRPVPIGVSVGNRFECSAGTIGARVKDANNKVYILSNNHVLALENEAAIGNRVVQPGLFDSDCRFNRDNILGYLYDFEPISFTNDNVMDAAIARTTRKRLSRITPDDGYGRVKATTVPAALGLQVQKYGRTSLLTRAAITAINGLADVTYTAGTARFVNQIVVESTAVFILAGDSGSLLVTDPGRNPVGLLFAGTADGKLAVANPIDPILQRFGVTIDGVDPPAATSTHGRILKDEVLEGTARGFTG